MDNFQINVVAEGEQSLLKAIELAFAHNAPGSRIDSYEIAVLERTGFNDVPERLHGRTALILRWVKRRDDSRPAVVDLPFKLDAKGAADFATRWLAEQDYGKQPSHDGDNGKGWRVFTTGTWGHVADDHYAVCAVVPEWAMYGK